MSQSSLHEPVLLTLSSHFRYTLLLVLALLYPCIKLLLSIDVCIEIFVTRMSNPTLIECDPPVVLELKAMYSKHWQTLQTGHMLLRVGLPGIIENARVTVIKELPPPKERIYEARVASLKMVPSVTLASEAFFKLQPGDSWGIHIAGIGNFPPSALKLLPGAARGYTCREGQGDAELDRS